MSGSFRRESMGPAERKAQVAAVATSNGSSGATTDGAAVPGSSSGDASNNVQAASANDATPKRRWGFDKVEPIKNISLNLKWQPRSETFPAPQPGTVYTNRFAHMRDLLFVVNSLNKVWTLNTGMNRTF